MKQQELIEKLNMFLNEEDPPHALLLLGISKASNWLNELELHERKVIFNYFAEKLSLNGDIPIKEQIIKILQRVGGGDSVELLDIIISQGKTKHGEYIVQDAIHARSKMK